ncbi:MAG: NEW3 domain-containing protein [Stellaceae bacterium]
MHRVFWLPISLLALAAAHAQAADAPHIKGLWLTTDYPSLAAQAGRATTLQLKLQNDGLPPARVALSVSDVPAGWTAAILGNGVPVSAAMPATDDNVALTLRVDVPANARVGTDEIVLHAKGAGTIATLPIDITIGQNLPPQLAITTDLPSLRGTPTTSFKYTFHVANDSAKDTTVSLTADAPPGFQTSFTESYETQELSSLPIPAGKTKDLQVQVQPPDNVKAGDYPVVVHASANSVTASTQLEMQITGQPELSLSGAGDRLSASAEAGRATTISLIVRNDGSAPAHDIRLSGSPPSAWKVDFTPASIAALAPNQKATVQAQLTPSDQALAGDYMTTFSADGKGASTSANFRITVETSTLWGIVGIAIIAAALLIAVGAVARFGRR